MKTPETIKFSFYGFGIEVTSEDLQTLDNVKRDFSFFLDDNAPRHTSFEVFNKDPDYQKLPALKASFYTPRNICYQQGQTWFIDYIGKGLTIVDHVKNIYQVYCTDAHLRHEIVFLSILSLTGQYFDAKHMHRVHGLGLGINNKAVLVLLPSGGGKTTLGLDLIKKDGIKLLSEDSALIDASGKVFPFPLRIGVCHGNKPPDIPDRQMHLTHRMEFEPKYLIDIDYFKNKIAQDPLEIGYIFCAIRCLGKESKIAKLSKYAAFQALLREMVVGVGLYQGIEFLFQNSPWQLIKKCPVIFSRLRNSLSLLSKASAYSFVMGSDIPLNTDTLLEFFEKNDGKKI